MRRGVAATAVVSAWVGLGLATGHPGMQTAAAQARPSAASALPRFQVDPAWPKIPNNWQFGQVASVSIDAQDHVWVLQRPGTLSPEEKPRAAPPLLEFDAAGTFIQAWGGPGQGYEWPASEHGVYVDPKGFVWIGGNGAKDHQILKLTKAGKFVMQIGRAGQSKATPAPESELTGDTFVYATNELFVAGSWQPARIVFDADTGRFKDVAFDIPTGPPKPRAGPTKGSASSLTVQRAFERWAGMFRPRRQAGAGLHARWQICGAGLHRPGLQGAGLRERYDRRQHGVLDRSGAALPVRR